MFMNLGNIVSKASENMRAYYVTNSITLRKRVIYVL